MMVAWHFLLFPISPIQAWRSTLPATVQQRPSTHTTHRKPALNTASAACELPQDKEVADAAGATGIKAAPAAGAMRAPRGLGMPKGTFNRENHIIIHKRYWLAIDKAPFDLPRTVTVGVTPAAAATVPPRRLQQDLLPGPPGMMMSASPDVMWRAEGCGAAIWEDWRVGFQCGPTNHPTGHGWTIT